MDEIDLDKWVIFDQQRSRYLEGAQGPFGVELDPPTDAHVLWRVHAESGYIYTVWVPGNLASPRQEET